ncbi:hypothetical protein CIPAW_11G108300 [Carya illinoinensis]|uniref:RING-CH-type domain-containing protein n=1 Tax=Carya illinoinensis TaxID=32201 RepID=A0A8T1NW36_CARIL|nr:hypothetical protein CIPAW_11G108300 [Carya illinoinensis]
MAARIERLYREFLWSGIGDEFKFHLISWDKVCRPISSGGLGLKNLRTFNQALLGKWLWRYNMEPEALWKLVVESKHGSLWGGWCTREGIRPCGVGIWKHIRRGWGVCQQEKEEILIDLGCHCRGGLAKAHRSCIDTWFCTRGSNKCEICQEVAANVPPPDSQPSTNYWVWRNDTNFRHQDRERNCFSPLWVAFSILVCGLLLDVLISITLGISALPINVIIGVIIVLGLGTGLRVALDFFHEWSLRRVVQRVETNVSLGYHPAI